MATKKNKSTKTNKVAKNAKCGKCAKKVCAKKAADRGGKHLVDILGFEMTFAVGGLLAVMMFVFGMLVF